MFHEFDSLLAGTVFAVHVLAGVTALLAGLAAIATRKGRPRHNAAGRLYAASMAVVVTTAVPLAIRATNWFLLAVAVFSGYLVFTGYRVLLRRRAGLTEPTVVDYAGHGTMIAVGGTMVAVGVAQSLAGAPGLAPALAAFGGIGAALAVSQLRELRRPPAERSTWIRWHVSFMGGAYVATVTAAVTVNLDAVAPLVRWLGPTAVGVPLIAYAIRVYRPRFAPTG